MSAIQIRHRWTDAVLFEHETTEERQASGLAIRDALEAATKAGANLEGANLARAYLAGANLARANLEGAYLAGAYLDGANLDGANGQKLALIGSRPVFQIGPIGSRCATLTMFLTDGGPMVRAGCFWGSLEQFEAKCEATHGDSLHGREYAMACVLMLAHVELWTPAVEQVKEAA